MRAYTYVQIRTDIVIFLPGASTGTGGRVDQREPPPLAAHRTVREALTSYGSCYSTLSDHELPVRKQRLIPLSDSRQHFAGATLMPPVLLIAAPDPLYQPPVQYSP